MTGGNVWRWNAPPWHDETVVRAVLRIEFTDGRTQDLVTDDSWTIADGPTLFDDLYAAETYDARQVRDGFDRAGFDDQAWAPATAAEGPRGVWSTSASSRSGSPRRCPRPAWPSLSTACTW